MQIIRNRAIVDDGWTHVPAGQTVPERGDVIVDLRTWKAEREALTAREGKVGVRLQSSDEPEDIAQEAAALPLVAVEFPKFADGRGYTTGRLLRERFGFTGELRAVGDVLRDQLRYMERCGYDAFELKDGKDLREALGGFGEFSVEYQGDATEPRPLYRRRPYG